MVLNATGGEKGRPVVADMPVTGNVSAKEASRPHWAQYRGRIACGN